MFMVKNNIGIYLEVRWIRKKRKYQKKKKNRGRDILETDSWLDRRKRKKVRFFDID